MVGHFGDHIEVVGDARHDVAGLHVVEVVEAELLDVAEDVAAHVRLDAHTQNVAPLDADVVQGQSYDIDGRHGRDRPGHRLQVLIRDVGFQQAAGQVGEKDRQTGHQDGGAHVQNEQWHMGFVVSCKASDQHNALL